MPIDETKREEIETIIKNLNIELNKILFARENIQALLRIDTDINDDSIENNILNNSKTRAKDAAQEIVNLLS